MSINITERNKYCLYNILVTDGTIIQTQVYLTKVPCYFCFTVLHCKRKSFSPPECLKTTHTFRAKTDINTQNSGDISFR